MFSVSALISDHDLQRISRCAPIPSIEQLRRYLVRWARVDSHLESMWNALEEGGFTKLNPPVKLDTPVASSQPAKARRATQKPLAPPKPQANKAHLQDVKPDTSTSTAHTPYLNPPPNAPGELLAPAHSLPAPFSPTPKRHLLPPPPSISPTSRHLMPTSSEPLPKRRRLDTTMFTPKLSQTSLYAPQANTNSLLQRRTMEESFHMPARPVARLTISSRNPENAYSAPSGSWPTLLPPPVTRRMSVELQHPVPIRASLQPRISSAHLLPLILRRPPAPVPPSCTL